MFTFVDRCNPGPTEPFLSQARRECRRSGTEPSCVDSRIKPWTAAAHSNKTKVNKEQDVTQAIFIKGEGMATTRLIAAAFVEGKAGYFHGHSDIIDYKEPQRKPIWNSWYGMSRPPGPLMRVPFYPTSMAKP